MSRTARLWLAVVPAALASAGAVAAVILTSDHQELPVLSVVLGGLTGLSFIGAGLIARTRRPLNRTGLLLIAVGFAWFAAGLAAANDSLLWAIGVSIGAIFAAFLVHLLIAYPSGELRSRWERAVVAIGYVLAGSANLLLLLFDRRPIDDCEECPDNAFLVRDNETISDLLTALVEGFAVVYLLAVVVTLVRRWRASTPAARRLLAPVLLGGTVALFFLSLNVGTQEFWQTLADVFGWLASIAFTAVPYLFLWGILQSRIARAELAPLMSTHYTLGELDREIRRLLRDPTARLLVWLEGRNGYIDAEGRPYEGALESSEQAMTEIEDEHGRLGALVHDPALRGEELLADLAAALRMNLQHLRSTAALEASERRSRALLEALPDNMFRISRDGVYLDFHAHDPSQLRLPPEKLIGSSVWDYPVPHQATQELMATAERAFATGVVQTFEFQAEGADGTIVHREGRVTPSGPDEFLLVTRDITDRKRAEQELRSSEQRSRALLEAIPDLMFRASRDGTFLDVHAGELPPLRPVEEIVGMNVYDYPIPRELMDRFMAAAEAGFETGESQTFEYELDREGRIRHQEARLSPIGDDEFFVMIRDVTEARRQQRELQRERDFIATVVNTAPSYFAVVDLAGRIVRFNRTLEVTSGYDDDETTRGKHFWDVFFAPEEHDEGRGAIREMEDGLRSEPRETTWRTRDGDPRSVAWSLTPLVDAEGEPRYLLTGLDVTQLRREERLSRHQRELVSTIAEITFGLHPIVDAEGRLHPGGFNRAFTETTGWTPENAAGRVFWEYLVPPEERDAMRAALEEVIAGAPPRRHDSEWLTSDGRRISVEWEARPITDLDGNRLYVISAVDVTSRKAREEEEAALRRVAVAVASEPRPEQIFAVVTEEVGRVFGAHTANLVRFEPGGKEIVIVGRWSEPGVHSYELGMRIPLVGGPITLVEQTEAPVRMDVESAAPDWAEQLRKLGVNSVVAAPITVSGRLWGAVNASLTPPNSFPPGSEHRLASFTRLVSLALANAEAREELAAQRARIVQAGDEERRRLERNLHDGAQQRLVSLSLSLRLAQSKLLSDPHVADELLSSASVELALALEELRELARGIHPAVLTERGLGPALESLADRAPLPVELEQVPDERLPGQVEAAAYYVVSEALANVAKYAEASAVSVRVAQENGRAVVEVADDGVGGADPARGSGLRGLTDRVEALEGYLAVDSRPGEGTTIRAEIPVRGSAS